MYMKIGEVQRSLMYKLKIYFKSVILVTGIFLLSGCGASSLMMKVPPLGAPDNQHAMVTFLRPAVFFGDAIRFGVWDSENFVGILARGSYVQYITKPGEHLFLARAENWSYVKADLEAGKHYFIFTRVFPGGWKARVAFDPITKDYDLTKAQIDKLLSRLTPTAVIPEKFDDYARPRLSQVREAIDDYKAENVKYEVLEADDHR